MVAFNNEVIPLVIIKRIYDFEFKDNEMTLSLKELDIDTTYYWKVLAKRNGPFISESSVYSFTILDE